VIQVKTREKIKLIDSSLSNSGNCQRDALQTHPELESSDRSRRDHAPAGQDGRTGSVANEQIIVEVPNRCLACARIMKQVVGSSVAIEIG